jgi:hypothetical protein
MFTGATARSGAAVLWSSAAAGATRYLEIGTPAARWWLLFQNELSRVFEDRVR